jgi:hypothetical protein
MIEKKKKKTSLKSSKIFPIIKNISEIIKNISESSKIL